MSSSANGGGKEGASRSHRGPSIRDVLLLTALCLALYLPGLARIPPVDRDEARFMQSTRQMLESGDFVHPRFQSEDRFRKPAGIYWLQALSVSMMDGPDRARPGPYRVPSAAGAWAAVLLTYYFGALWYPRQVALAGAVFLAASLLLVVEAHLATTDAALLALIIAAQGCLGVLWLSARRGRIAPARYAAGFWLAQGIAILIKGPVAPLIGALTLAASIIVREPGDSSGDSPSTSFAHRARRIATNLRCHWGIPFLLAIVLPWTIAIEYETSGAFLRDCWNGDLLPKLIGGHESHGAPPGTYLVLLPLTFWPGSLALFPAFRFLRTHRRTIECFCLAWLVPAWLVFEIVPTKLPHYILPLLPPLALISARAVLSTRWARPVFTALAVSVVLSMATLGLVLPNLATLWLSQRVAGAVAQHRATGDHSPVAASGYHEPSLVFLLGGDIDLVDAAGLATFLRDHPEGLGIITAEEHASFGAAAAAIGVDTQVLWSGDGLNYSKGQRTRLLLIANQRVGEMADGRHAAPADHQALVTR